MLWISGITHSCKYAEFLASMQVKDVLMLILYFGEPCGSGLFSLRLRLFLATYSLLRVRLWLCPPRAGSAQEVHTNTHNYRTDAHDWATSGRTCTTERSCWGNDVIGDGGLDQILHTTHQVRRSIRQDFWAKGSIPAARNKALTLITTGWRKRPRYGGLKTRILD